MENLEKKGFLSNIKNCFSSAQGGNALERLVAFTLKFGATLTKISYIVIAAIIVIAGVITIFGGFVAFFTNGFVAGLLGIIGGLLGTIVALLVLLLSYYGIFLFIDIHTQLVKLNEK